MNYKSKIKNHVRPRWEAYKLTTITKTALESWIALELHSLANKTINEIMIILRGIFKDAKADNIRSDSPIDALDSWRAHLKKAQVRYRGPNTARHTFISQLLTAGIAKAMDHSPGGSYQHARD